MNKNLNLNLPGYEESWEWKTIGFHHCFTLASPSENGPILVNRSIFMHNIQNKLEQKENLGDAITIAISMFAISH